MPVDRAAEAITLYYVGMTLGRFLSGILANKLSSWQLIQIGQGIVFAAILLLLLPLANMMAAVGLFLIGLGNGPAFPNLLHLTPKTLDGIFHSPSWASRWYLLTSALWPCL